MLMVNISSDVNVVLSGIISEVIFDCAVLTTVGFTVADFVLVKVVNTIDFGVVEVGTEVSLTVIGLRVV